MYSRKATLTFATHILPPIAKIALNSPTINLVTPINITLFCMTFDTVSKAEHRNVSLAIYLSFLLVTVGTIHVQKVIDIVRDSNFDAKQFSSQIYSI